MEPSVSVVSARPPVVRLLLARWLQRIGWAGSVGIVLMVLAIPFSWGALSAQRHLVRIAAQAQKTNLRLLVSPAKVVQASQMLPGREDIPQLLKKIERAATRNGLTWSGAEYRFVPPTASSPAALEVRWAFKAPYAKTRAMLIDVFDSVRAVALRELTFSRDSIDSAEVETKLALAVFVTDGVVAGGGGKR